MARAAPNDPESRLRSRWFGICWPFGGEWMPRYERLTQPLVRNADGELMPATWDEALERVATGFSKARDAGPQAFGVFSCSKASNEMNFAAQRFARQVMGTNNIDSCNRT